MSQKDTFHTFLAEVFKISRREGGFVKLDKGDEISFFQREHGNVTMIRIERLLYPPGEPPKKDIRHFAYPGRLDQMQKNCIVRLVAELFDVDVRPSTAEYRS